MKDLSSSSLSTSDIFFFFGCSPLFADGMQRMQIGAPLFPGPLPWMNAALNEATLSHVLTEEEEEGPQNVHTLHYAHFDTKSVKYEMLETEILDLQTTAEFICLLINSWCKKT